MLGAAALPAMAQNNPFGRAGFELGEGDLTAMSVEVQKLVALDESGIGQSGEWSNPESGNHGRVKLVGVFEHQELPCRRLQHDIKLKTVSDPYRLFDNRCQLPSGEWKGL